MTKIDWDRAWRMHQAQEYERELRQQKEHDGVPTGAVVAIVAVELLVAAAAFGLYLVLRWLCDW